MICKSCGQPIPEAVLFPDEPEDDPLPRIWSYYQKKIGKSLATFTDKRKKMAKKRFAEALEMTHGDRAKAEEFMEIAIDELARSEWHQGKNPNNKKYNDFEYAFRSSEDFQRWLNESNGE